jgi:hypothetical protein
MGDGVQPPHNVIKPLFHVILNIHGLIEKKENLNKNTAANQYPTLPPSCLLSLLKLISQSTLPLKAQFFNVILIFGIV